ncbi:MAG: helix-turn-helix domain-containing protein [Thermodesulfobacteriota bacterium]
MHPVSLKKTPTESSSYSYDLKEMGKKARAMAEREHIQNTLAYTNWNRKAAARLLQVSYKALLYKIQKYRLNHLTPYDGQTKE